MAVGGDTYADDLLRLCGGHNVFRDREDRRYPIVEVDEIVAGAPEVILLPDEPYAFGPREVAELEALDVPAARSGRVHLLDGTLISWYGPRMGRAIETLCALLAP
jgi:ABC-type Fe3+-hydroxamate transport system substrate-binding protein